MTDDIFSSRSVTWNVLSFLTHYWQFPLLITNSSCPEIDPYIDGSLSYWRRCQATRAPSIINQFPPKISSDGWTSGSPANFLLKLERVAQESILALFKLLSNTSRYTHIYKKCAIIFLCPNFDQSGNHVNIIITHKHSIRNS